MDKEIINKLLEVLENNKKDKHELFSDITDSIWWKDKNELNNREREKYLYERFLDMYDAIIEKYKFNIVAFDYINICKIQLDVEFQLLFKMQSGNKS